MHDHGLWSCLMNSPLNPSAFMLSKIELNREGVMRDLPPMLTALASQECRYSVFAAVHDIAILGRVSVVDAKVSI